MHDIIYRIKYIFCIRVAEIIAVGAVSRPVVLGGQGFRLGIKVVIAALFFQHFLHHICRGPAGDIFIKEEDLVGLFQGFRDGVIDVERQQRLHIDEFGADIEIVQLFCGIFRNPDAGAIGDDGDIGPFDQ